MMKIDGNRITFSVVIPAYNAASTVSRAIESVISQSHSADEIVLVDDGSDDDIESVVEEYREYIQYVKQPNQGSAVARQAGTNLANSEYIVYLDADDWWPKDKLENLYNILLLEEVDFLLADLNRAILLNGQLEYLPRNTSFFPWAEKVWKNTPADSGYDHLYRMSKDRGLSVLLSGFPVFPSTMMVSKDAIESCGGWDARFRRCQDFDIGLRLARKYPLYFLDKIHATLGIHVGNSDSIDYSIKQTTGDINVLRAHKEMASNLAYRKKVLQAMSKKYCQLAHLYRKKHDFDMAVSCYEHAMKLPGNRMHSSIRYLLLRLWY